MKLKTDRQYLWLFPLSDSWSWWTMEYLWDGLSTGIVSSPIKHFGFAKAVIISTLKVIVTNALKFVHWASPHQHCVNVHTSLSEWTEYFLLSDKVIVKTHKYPDQTHTDERDFYSELFISQNHLTVFNLILTSDRLSTDN